MELSKLEVQILSDIYDADMSAKPAINFNNYELTETDTNERKQEFAFYLSKLKRLGFIEYEDNKAFSCGGWRSQKYRLNVLIFWSENIHIAFLGIRLVEEVRKATADNLKEKGISAPTEETEFNELFVKNMNEYLNRISSK